MLKKLAYGTLATATILSAAPTVFASSVLVDTQGDTYIAQSQAKTGDLSPEEQTVLNRLKQELKTNSKKIQEQALNNNKVKLYSSNAEIEEIKEKYPNVIERFTWELDALNPEKAKEKLENVTLTNNDQKVVEFDDGSFIILTQEVGEKTSSENFAVAAETVYKPITYKKEIWGVYKAAELHLISNFYYNKSIATVTTTSTAQWAYYPTSIVSKEAKITNQSGSFAATRGEFMLRDSIGGGDLPISREYTIVLISKCDKDGNVTNTTQ
ncbi:hypothetical protein [Aneurinibacillus aneurinilyticus]|uniref:Uncharacterized protein n=1 Tax=Aneurinibacillus aneurinilyticus TaxID=1391 RepID=A0A848CT35_ANEAE|nr:hypothetical protein [Aneurinibacillus aneurinilyticus]NME98338.1 hypothetical protein [Aneurinibacillus aneurinilyticus]